MVSVAVVVNIYIDARYRSIDEIRNATQRHLLSITRTNASSHISQSYQREIKLEWRHTMATRDGGERIVSFIVDLEFRWMQFNAILCEMEYEWIIVEFLNFSRKIYIYKHLRFIRNYRQRPEISSFLHNCDSMQIPIIKLYSLIETLIKQVQGLKSLTLIVSINKNARKNFKGNTLLGVLMR